MNAFVTEEKVRNVISSYKAGADYPDSGLGSDMRAVAAMIAAGLGTRIYSLDLAGFDTHSNQLGRHAELMGEVSGAISAFLSDLRGKKLADKVIVMPFSEFGRRPYENGSSGTDHGTNSVFFVAGGAVKGGLYGKHPTIPKDNRSDIPFTEKSTDFRQLYAIRPREVARCRPQGDPRWEIQAARFLSLKKFPRGGALNVARPNARPCQPGSPLRAGVLLLELEVPHRARYPGSGLAGTPVVHSDRSPR